MGFLAALLSAIFSSAKDLLSKRLAFRLDGTVSTFASFGFALPFYVLVLAVLYLLGVETFTWSLPFLGLVFLRSVTDTFAEGMKMYAFAHGDISIVATFFSLSPLFLLITSPLITQDSLSLSEVVAVVLVVGGSLPMVYRPSMTGWAAQKKGILLASGAALFFSLNSCFDRLAVQRGTPVFSGFTMTLLSALFLLPFIIFRRDRLRALRAHRAGLLIRGGLEVAFMVCKLWALQFLQAPDVVAVQRFALVLSIIGGRIFFKEPDFKRRLAAGILILGGVFVVAWMQRGKLEALIAHLRFCDRKPSGSHGGASVGPSRFQDCIVSVKGPWRERWLPKLRSDEVPLNPYRVLGDLMKVLDPAQCIVTHDSGSPRDQLVPLYEAVTPRGYLGWGHSTQLWLSLGLAMGAKLAAPDKTVVNVMGDAAFGMVGMDLEMAVRERIPILTVLLNNSAMGNYERLIPKATKRYGTKYLSGEYSTVARGLGAYAERIDQPHDIIPALQRALVATREGRAALVEFITPEEPDMAIPTGHEH